MQQQKTEIASIQDFEKLDIRVGQIQMAEAVKGSTKLLRLEINIGEKTIQTVAGIAAAYNKEELFNKKVAVLTNLQPTEIFGVLSECMVLAAIEDKNIVLLVPDKNVKIGAKIR
ncbi:MAG: methionine--tRNA ligase subunit beta [Euryarchaeota archaeon]|nr:methionine--tRNA ligase subunit beta [Euryarchaeota archaeon]